MAPTRQMHRSRVNFLFAVKFLIAVILQLTALASIAALPAEAQADGIQVQDPAPDAVASAAIRGIISDQMAAFRRDDAAAAFAAASPFIQQKFGHPDLFLDLVRNAYAPVYRPRKVEFRDLVQTEAGLDQRVFVIGPDGRAYLAHYLMQRQPDGTWKINGCVLEQLSDQSV